MPTATREGLPHIVTATTLEAWVARLALRGTPVTRTGVALQRGLDLPPGSTAITAGLAGSLTPDLSTGDVVVPEHVGLPDGTLFSCDPTWTEALRAAATVLGCTVITAPLLTAPSLVTGDARAVWAKRGYVAADMETALLAAQGVRVATVRVILDTPTRSIAADWERPTRALLTPGLWLQLLWLATTAPHYALLAARIVRRALRTPP